MQGNVHVPFLGGWAGAIPPGYPAKGPVAIEMVKRRVQTRIERKRTGPDEWLVVTRRPLADDRALEPRASRDATDQDAHYRYHYYLTPTDGGKVAFKEPSLGELGRVIKQGHSVFR